jgi:hypothetical protein
LDEVSKLTIHPGGDTNTFELSPTKILSHHPAVQSIGLHSSVLALWGSSMARRSSTDTLGPQAHHTSRSLSVQPHRQRLPSDRESACARDSKDAPRYTACAAT